MLLLLKTTLTALAPDCVPDACASPRGDAALGEAALPSEALAESSAGSQSDAATPDEGLQPTEATSVEVVVTGTRTPESMHRSTLPTGVVTQADARRRGATNVAEALSGELGLQVNPNSYGYLGSPSGVQMQGLDAERVLILQDGERVVGDVGGVVDLASFSLSGVERIEYVTGPSSSLYGAGALGGVVNIITAPPQEDGLSASTRLEARTRRTYAAQGEAAYREGATWASANAAYHDAAGVRLFPDEPDLALPEITRSQLGLTLGVAAPRTEASFTARWSRDDAVGLQSQTVPNLRRFLIDTPSLTDRVLVRGTNRSRLSDNASLKASVSGQWFENRSAKDRHDSPLDEHRERTHSLGSAEVSAALDGVSTTWLFGVRAEREAFVQQLAKHELQSGVVTRSEETEVPKTELLSGALYAQFGYRPHPELTLMPGLRLEYYDRFGDVWAPRLAAAYRPTPEFSFRVAGGRGFRAPNAKEFGFFFDHSFIGYRVIGNDALKPEVSWGLSGDVTWAPTFWPRTRVRLAVFSNWISNLIGTEFVNQSEVGIDDYSYINVGRARTAGGEASLGVNVWPTLRAEVGYAYLYTRNEDTGVPLESRPPHTVLTSVVYQPTPGLELMLRQRTVSSAYLTPELNTPPFSILDTRAACHVMASTEVYVALLNALGAQDAPVRPGDQRPVVGRTVLVGVHATFAGEQE